MNRQLHILSSKYIEFNNKISRFITDFNRTAAKRKIYPDDVIDSDAKPFMVTERTKPDVNKDMSKRKTDLLSNRFVKPYDKHEYTRMIRVEIRSTNDGNLDQIKCEFENNFESFIGKRILKKAMVTRYRFQDEKITSISFVVEFQIPLNYEYINNIKFPSEWFFSPMYKQQHNAARFTWQARTNSRASTVNP